MKTIKMTNKITHRALVNSILVAGACVLVLAVFANVPAFAADEPGLTDEAKEAAKETKSAVNEVVQNSKEAVQDAGRTAADSFENLWRRVDESRLKYRSRDEIVAWILMGVLVGSVAGMMTSLKSSGWGKVGRLILGLGGALIGGMVVNAAQINFGWGPVLIRYEELLFSMLGAILLIFLWRLLRVITKKKPAEK
jgi:uncharacterized membrane protein YeaQ/YmgE (transglycosylase-associated protein family)